MGSSWSISSATSEARSAEGRSKRAGPPKRLFVLLAVRPYNGFVRTLFAWCLPLVAAACFTPDLGDGAVACGANGLCPPLYFCHAADQRCYKTPDSGGAVDMSVASGGDLASAGGDLARADLASCSKAACGPRNCGTILDGCGGVENCGGPCPSPQSCGGGNASTRQANVCSSGPACTPRQCQQGQDCGLISDGCSAVLNCGMCGGGSSCGSDHQCH